VTATVEASIDKLAKEKSAIVGVYFRRLDTGETIEYNSDRAFPAASVIKIPIMIEVFRQVSQGRYSLDQMLVVDKDTGGPRGSGILKHLALPVPLSVHNLVTLMIILSDNTASNKLIDLAGFDNITGLCRELGVPDVVLKRYFVGAGISDITKDNTLSAKSMGILLEKLYNGEVVSREASDEMLTIMKKQQVNHKIPRYLPLGTVIAHKTGTQEITSHDAGIVFGPEGSRKDYIVAICCTGVPAKPVGDDIVASVSDLLYQHAMRLRTEEV
jgi:beta-lactamase class A